MRSARSEGGLRLGAALAWFAAVAVMIGCGGGGTGLDNGGTGGNGGDTGGGSGGGTGGGGGSSSGGSTAGVTGRIHAEGFPELGLAGVRIAFYDAGNAVTGELRTDSTGSFSGFIPPSSRRFFLVRGSLPTGYWNSFTYGRDRYSLLDERCKPALPPLIEGSTVPLGVITVPMQSSPPPPPPTGCRE